MHTEAEFAALGGEVLAQEDDLYEKCAAPARCYCWTRFAPTAVAGVDHTDADASQDNGISLCRAISHPKGSSCGGAGYSKGMNIQDVVELADERVFVEKRSKWLPDPELPKVENEQVANEVPVEYAENS